MRTRQEVEDLRRGFVITMDVDPEMRSTIQPLVAAIEFILGGENAHLEGLVDSARGLREILEPPTCPPLACGLVANAINSGDLSSLVDVLGEVNARLERLEAQPR